MTNYLQEALEAKARLLAIDDEFRFRVYGLIPYGETLKLKGWMEFIRRITRKEHYTSI